MIALLLAAAMPVVPPMKPYKLPERQEWRMDNGMRVALVEDHRQPLITAALVFPGGSAAYPAEDSGLVDAMAELLTDGTRTRTSRQIAEAADAFGGDISGSADHDSVRIGASGLAEKLDALVSLMAETALAPSFPEAEVTLRRANMLEELKAARAQPDFLASVAFFKRLFPGHPYGVTAPTEASIARLTRERIVEAHKRLVTPRDALFVLVGDAEPEALKAVLERRFGAWKGGPRVPDAPAAGSAPGKRRVFLVDRPGSSQVSLFLGNLAVREDNPEYFNLVVANQVLGGSFASRLVQDVRETKGYTYRIGSRLEHRLTASLFRIRTPVRNEVVVPALKLILEHVERLRDGLVPAAELDKAKSYLAGGFARSMETQEGVLEAVVHMKLHRLPSDFYDTYVERLQAVTAEGARRAARQFILPSELTVVAVGDGKAVRDGLARFSTEPVADLDEDGEPATR